jgi:hypothetical protein
MSTAGRNDDFKTTVNIVITTSRCNTGMQCKIFLTSTLARSLRCFANFHIQFVCSYQYYSGFTPKFTIVHVAALSKTKQINNERSPFLHDLFQITNLSAASFKLTFPNSQVNLTRSTWGPSHDPKEPKTLSIPYQLLGQIAPNAWLT